MKTNYFVLLLCELFLLTFLEICLIFLLTGVQILSEELHGTDTEHKEQLQSL